MTHLVHELYEACDLDLWSLDLETASWFRHKIWVYYSITSMADVETDSNTVDLRPLNFKMTHIRCYACRWKLCTKFERFATFIFELCTEACLMGGLRWSCPLEMFNVVSPWTGHLEYMYRTSPGVEKMVFKLLVFWFKKQKPWKVEFFGFYGFWILIFSYKLFCAQTIQILFL